MPSMCSGMMRSWTVYPLRPLAPLIDATVSGLFPITTATMGDRGGRGDLLQAVRGNLSPSGHFTFPSQTQADGTGGPGRSAATRGGGPLNPTWVEGLMGFLAGWTDVT